MYRETYYIYIYIYTCILARSPSEAWCSRPHGRDAARIHIYIYIYIHMYTHIHTYTYIHSYMQLLPAAPKAYTLKCSKMCAETKHLYSKMFPKTKSLYSKLLPKTKSLYSKLGPQTKSLYPKIRGLMQQTPGERCGYCQQLYMLAAEVRTLMW